MRVTRVLRVSAVHGARRRVDESRHAGQPGRFEQVLQAHHVDSESRTAIGIGGIGSHNRVDHGIVSLHDLDESLEIEDIGQHGVGNAVDGSHIEGRHVVVHRQQIVGWTPDQTCRAREQDVH